MTLIEYQGSSFISNDRILINKSLLMFSLPMPVRISPASIVSSKVLNEYILENRNKLCRKTNIEDIILSKNGDRRPQKKIELSPLEISNCFHKNYIDISKLRIVIVPEFINKDLGEIRITPINIDDISQMLRSNCYTPNDPLWIEPWFFRKPINLDSVKRCIDAIANKVPTFKVQYGSDIQNVFKQKKSNWFIEELMENGG